MSFMDYLHQQAALPEHLRDVPKEEAEEEREAKAADLGRRLQEDIDATNAKRESAMNAKYISEATYGDIWLHEFADGRLMEFRRDHAYSPDLFIECRMVRPDGTEFDGEWSRIAGSDWAWMEDQCGDLLADIKAECI